MLVRIELEDIVTFGLETMHSGRHLRHARCRDTNDLRTLREQPFDIGGRHMTFHDISVNQCRMAGIQRRISEPKFLLDWRYTSTSCAVTLNPLSSK